LFDFLKGGRGGGRREIEAENGIGISIRCGVLDVK